MEPNPDKKFPPRAGIFFIPELLASRIAVAWRSERLMVSENPAKLAIFR
jgi:hypothetical protein